MAADNAVSRDPGRYGKWTQERVRFADTDMYGHVNHAAMVTLFETGRSVLAFSTANRHLLPDGAAPMVRVLNVEYIGELTYPAIVRLGFRIGRLGRTSFVVEQIMLDNDKVVATAALTYVIAITSGAGAVAIPDEARTYLQSMSF